MHMIRVATEIEGEAYEEKKQNETNPKVESTQMEKRGGKEKSTIRQAVQVVHTYE